MKQRFNLLNKRPRATHLLSATFAALLIAMSGSSIADTNTILIDDFSDKTNNSFGLPRQILDDTMVGGSTQTEIDVNNGIIHLTGEIVPPRGQPGWASTVLLLDGEGKPFDASKYKGISMLVKIDSGSISISANSTEITNFDYHSSVVLAPADGKFHQVDIPFDSLKRSWSEQTELNTQTINSLSIVAYGIQKTTFDYEIDKVSFY